MPGAFSVAGMAEGNPGGTGTGAGGEPLVRFEAVSKSYAAGSRAVDDLTLTAPEGAITVLVGPSGCGKTTSLRMVNRMI